MRFNDFGQIAYNFERRALAAWLTNAISIEQQPVNDTDRDGPWRMMQKVNGQYQPLIDAVRNAGGQPLDGGCNFLAAGVGRWMRRFDAHTPQLSGSQGWTPTNGRVGDIGDSWACTVSEDARTLYIWRDGKQVAQYQRGPHFDEVRIKTGLMAWTEGAGPTIQVIDLETGERLPVQQLGPQAYTPIVFKQNGSVWIAYQCDAMGGLVHRIDDNSKGYRFAIPAQGKIPDIYNPDVWIHDSGEGCTIGWSKDPGEFTQGLLTILQLGEAMEPLRLPPVVVPVPSKPIGPTSAPLPKGTWIDVDKYFTYDAKHWPRGDKSKGDAHGMDMQPVTHRGKPCIWFAKFGNPSEIGRGDVGELYQIDGDYIHLLADVPKPGEVPPPGEKPKRIDICTDTRWIPRRIQVGREFSFKIDEMQLLKFTHEGVKTDTIDWSRESWVENAWPSYHIGNGVEVPAIEVVQNCTGVRAGKTTDNPGLFAERHFFALPAAWWWWTYDQALQVFANGGTDFSHPPHAQSRFSFPGGKRYTPVIPSFINIASEGPTVPPTEEPLSPTAVEILQRFWSINPVPQAPDSEITQGENGPQVSDAWTDKYLRHAPDGWLYRAAQTLCFFDSRWGQKHRGPGAPISAGRIARLEPDGRSFRDWDILVGAGTGRPVFTTNVTSEGVITEQRFVPVTPFNHLIESKPRPGRAPWPANVRHGLSGFDVAPRMERGDAEYYDFTEPLPLNSFVYTTIDHPQTHRLGRNFADGMRQTERYLQRLKADKRKAMFIMICGPAWVNNGPKLTRAEILDMVRQEIALFLRYPEAVLALSFGNELYQSGFESPEMLDRTLWDEVDALVPLQFPFCIGQVSDRVVFGSGSFAAMHPDRGKPSREALQILADARDRDGRVVVAREPKRIEAGNFGPGDQASGDLNFVSGELDNADLMNIPYFLHPKTGRGCLMSSMDDIERQAIAMIKAKAATSQPPGAMTYAQAVALVTAAYAELLTPPGGPTRVPDPFGLDYYTSRLMDRRLTDATMRAEIMQSAEYKALHPTPPKPKHPILDVVLNSADPRFMSHEGYNLMVFRRQDVEAAAAAWYRKATGRTPADSDVVVMVYIRGVAERDVWRTFRNAWENGLAGGAPD